MYSCHSSVVLAYISGALMNATDIETSRRLYEGFAEACRAAGWDAYVPHQHADPLRDRDMPNAEVAQRDLDQVRAADAVIAYLGEPSLGVGAEVAIALAAGKRVLAVAERDRRVSRFLLGLVELHPALAEVCRYERVADAEGWITARLASHAAPPQSH
jgi:nucleoside 2-deoxyribosyltransferase